MCTETNGHRIPLSWLAHLGMAPTDGNLPCHPTEKAALTQESARLVNMSAEQGKAPIELQLDYQRLNTFFADYVKNISRGGTFISTKKPLPVGTQFVFVLGVPGIEQPLRFDGKVMWVTSEEDASKANPPGMGIEIECPTEDDRRHMQQSVEQLMRRELGGKLTERWLGD